MRAFVRALLVLVLLAVLAFVAFNYWPAGSFIHAPQPLNTIGTSGAISTENARERGAELGEKAGAAAAKVHESLDEAGITTKIKAKMALDDTVKGREINVSTTGSTVTLSGTVESLTERHRAVALARETNGVDRVVDQLHTR
jgi:hyperosmotically inducible protein